MKNEKLWKKFNKKLNESATVDVIARAKEIFIPSNSSVRYDDLAVIADSKGIRAANIMNDFEDAAFAGLRKESESFKNFGFQKTGELGCTKEFLRANLVCKNETQSTDYDDTEDLDTDLANLKPVKVIYSSLMEIDFFIKRLLESFEKTVREHLKQTLGENNVIVDTQEGICKFTYLELDTEYFIRLYENNDNASNKSHGFKTIMLEYGGFRSEEKKSNYAGICLRQSHGGRSATVFLDGTIARTAGLSASSVTLVEELATAIAFTQNITSNTEQLKTLTEAALQNLQAAGKIDRKFTKDEVSSVIDSWKNPISSVISALKNETVLKNVGAAWNDIEHFSKNYKNMIALHPKQLTVFDVDPLTDPTDIVLLRKDQAPEYVTKKGRTDEITEDILSLRRIGVSLKKPENEEAVVHYIGDLQITSNPAIHFSKTDFTKNSVQGIWIYAPKNESSDSADFCLQLKDTIYNQLNLPKMNQAKKITVNFRTFSKSAKIVSAEVVGWRNSRGGKFGGKDLIKAMFGTSTRLYASQLSVDGLTRPVDIASGKSVIIAFLETLGIKKDFVLGSQTKIWEAKDNYYTDQTALLLEKVSLLLAQALKFPCINEDADTSRSVNTVVPYLKVN